MKMTKNRGKLVLAGITILAIPCLVKFLFTEGFNLPIFLLAEVFLWFSIAAFIFAGIILTAENKKWIRVIAWLCLLIFFTLMIRGPKNDDIDDGNTLAKKDSEIAKQEPIWRMQVKFNPKNPEGTSFLVPKPGHYTLRLVSGEIYDKLKYALKFADYPIQGTNYGPGAEQWFKYPKENCLAVLLIIDDMVGGLNIRRFPPEINEIRGISIKRGGIIFLNESFREDIPGVLSAWENNSGELIFEITKSK